MHEPRSSLPLPEGERSAAEQPGEGACGSIESKVAFDHFEDALEILVHVGVGDTNHKKTAGLKGV